VKDSRFTFHDVFACLLPGAVGLLALRLVWISFGPDPSPVLFQSHTIGALDVVLVLAAYYVGALMQALTSGGVKHILGKPEELMLDTPDVPETKRSWRILTEKMRECAIGKHWDSIPAEIRKSAQDKAERLIGQAAYKAGWLVRLCEELVNQQGRNEQRELYEYRMGFYRGSAGALALLTLAFMVPLVRTTTTVQLVVGAMLTPHRLMFAAFLTAVGSWLSCRRYAHFAKILVYKALLGSIAMPEGNSQTPRALQSMSGPQAQGLKVPPAA
jgi:hypothetical protein